jgi:hypothetical protein
VRPLSCDVALSELEELSDFADEWPLSPDVLGAGSGVDFGSVLRDVLRVTFTLAREREEGLLAEE